MESLIVKSVSTKSNRHGFLFKGSKLITTKLREGAVTICGTSFKPNALYRATTQNIVFLELVFAFRRVHEVSLEKFKIDSPRVIHFSQQSCSKHLSFQRKEADKRQNIIFSR